MNYLSLNFTIQAILTCQKQYTHTDVLQAFFTNQFVENLKFVRDNCFTLRIFTKRKVCGFLQLLEFTFALLVIYYH